MDLITMQELRELSGRRRGWCLSLFMPAHRRGKESEQDPIRFQNLLRQAENRLLAKGLRSPDAGEMLEPGRRLLQEPGFWRHQSDGLAVFLSSGERLTYRLPLRFEELLVISDRYHLKPLLPLLASDGHFYLLALSQNQVRLLEGTRHTVEEVDLEGRSMTMAEALPSRAPQKQLQFHTRTSASGGRRPAVFHGHDVSAQDKPRILQWFRRVDDELSGLLAGESSPLVLAGVDSLFPLYREANSHPHLVEEGIPGNPEVLRADELHAQAWPLVEPIFARARERASARYLQLAGSGKTTSDVGEAVVAAHQGRVADLFVAVGLQVWGSYDPETQAVHIRDEPDPGDEDLLDLAAIQCLLNGGAAYAVEPDQVPDGGTLAAVYRY